KHGMLVGKDLEQQRSGLREQIAGLDAGLAKKKSQPVKKNQAKDFHIGDAVRVLSLNLNGTVSTLPNAKGDLFVQMGILRSQVNISDLELLPDDAVSVEGKK